MLTFQLGINQPAVANFVGIFRVKLQQRLAGTQRQLHLPLFHERRFQRVEQFTHHFGVIRFIEILIEQLRHRADVALQPHVERMLVKRVAVKRVDQPQLFVVDVGAQQQLGRENHRHHRNIQMPGDPQHNRTERHGAALTIFQHLIQPQRIRQAVDAGGVAKVPLVVEQLNQAFHLARQRPGRADLFPRQRHQALELLAHLLRREIITN